MRRPIAVVLPFLFVAAAFASDVFIPIAGTVNNFHTDARIVNPEDQTITVGAQLLPICALNADGSTSCPASTAVVQSITLAPRSMKVLDDIVSNTLNSSGLAGIRLTSSSANDDFTATARIYAQTPLGTLGQFLTASEQSDGLIKGIIQQLKSNNDFRTNIGMLNPNSTSTSVTLFLHGATGVVAKRTINLQGFAVIGPTAVGALFSNIPAGTDLSDFWVAFQATQKIIAYGSVVDNATTDPTYVDAIEDIGIDSATSGPSTLTFDVAAHSFAYTITPGGKITAKVGDTVVLQLHTTDTTHGFQMPGFVDAVNLTHTAIERRFTVTSAGTFPFFCSFPSCGSGHSSMEGEMVVSP